GDRRATAMILANLGLTAVDLGDLTAGRTHLVESATIARDLRDTVAVALALEGLAGLLSARGDLQGALGLGAIAAQQRHRAGPAPRPLREWVARRLGVAAPPAMEEGVTEMTAEQAVAYALSLEPPPSPAARARSATLTPREQ